MISKFLTFLNFPINFKFVDDLVFFSIVGLILGARLGYVIFYNPSYYLQNPFEIIYLWQGGLSFHGGLLGIVIASLVLSKSNQIDFFQNKLISFKIKLMSFQNKWISFKIKLIFLQKK